MTETTTPTPRESEPVQAEREDVPVDESIPAGGEHEQSGLDLARLAWLLTSLAFLIAMVVLGLRGDLGYAAVTLAVALAAAINLL